ncbi:SusC/RagA family TonB-linked outer membrane protein [Thermoflavifilum thermophilum]|uniref:TonB-linked outer membrane protein, SusC/RagA family n=1 Tax=Thermoflavifilum thermophilum TaxID=1393122 RepID=A0A1I7NMA1_9BACT|nr:SusC/RagA family TonB-linked outer membrane protein [Thermoflavifilum thermophilum]SFV35793.1 TonB-linked outer membrane protein, SusC/RagA family [Thermoflavifilum thermophilum]
MKFISGIQKINWLKIMKFSGIQLIMALIFAGMSYARPGDAQVNMQQRVNLNMHDATIATVLHRLEKLTDVKFVYSLNRVNVSQRVDVDVTNARLDSILEEILIKNGIDYEVVNNRVVLIPGIPARKTSLTGLSQVSNLHVQIQDVEVRGKVMDENGNPLAGVTVQVKGTNIGTTTDNQGNYVIHPLSGNDTLVFSYIGYERQEIPISGRSQINVQLHSTATNLNQIVVVGYGTQKKISLTGSISSVSGKEVAESPVPNISNAIAGRVSGISMVAVSGQPGQDNPQINIRGIATTGNNAPLIVVDGVIRSNISEIDPNSIASVTVLKDAAAVAPYGLGGANGVILITTKQGEVGSPRLNINAYYGIQHPTYYPKMLNALDYMRLRDEAYYNENPNGTNPPFPPSYIQNYPSLNKSNPDVYPISNASRTIPHLNAPIQNYDLQLSGGTNIIKYYTQFGFLDQRGMFDPVWYRRYSYTLNLDVNATPTTQVHASLIGSIENTHSIDLGSNVNELIRSLYKYIPIDPLYYSNGLWGQSSGIDPIGILKAGYYFNDQNTQMATFSINQDLPFIKGLSVKALFAYDPTSNFIKNWHTPYYYYIVDTTTQPYSYIQQISSAEGNFPTYSFLNEQFIRNQKFDFQGYINYKNSFGKNSIEFLAVADLIKNLNDQFSAQRNHFVVPIDELSMGSSNKNDFDNSGTSSSGSQIGFVYRLSYNYNNKYFFEASGREDGHYYFAPGHRWGFFPAFSTGWIISQESFFSSLRDKINYLKIRGSWGKSGNLAGGPFQYLSAYNLYGNAYAFGSGALTQGSYISTESNPNITWEVSNKADIGFDATFWNILNFSFDYFHERRSGMLLPPAITVPVEYGLNLAQQNAGIMDNNGIDLNLSYNRKIGAVDFNLSGSFSYARNKMIQVFETPATYNNPRRRRTGRPYGTPFGYHALGLFKTSEDKNGDGIINASDGWNVAQFGTLHPGDIKYADLNGDGKIDANDETVIGHPQYPEITYGFTPSISWNGFDVTLFFQGAAISSINVIGFQTVPFYNNNSNSTYEYYNHRWTVNTQNAKYPRANQAPYANNTQTSDFWMVNSGYLRLKTAVIGYSIPDKIVKKIGMQQLRFYVSGQNIFTISKLKFMDPQTTSNNFDGNNIDYFYPIQSVYTVGLNVQF